MASERLEGTWTILCYTWLAFSLIAVHIADPLWKLISKCFKGKKVVGSIIVYSIICGILGIGITAALYFIFIEFF